jgi:endonuclease/exonuclease/phosphatase family metal-dependent hydrolase
MKSPSLRLKKFLPKLLGTPITSICLITATFAEDSPDPAAQKAQASVAENQIVIATWNICHARGSMQEPIPSSKPDERDKRLMEIVGVLRKHQPDVVILNECSFDSTIVGGENQAALIAREIDLPHRVQLDCGGLELGGTKHHWGNAILSRFPIMDSSEISLPAPQSLDALLGIKRKDALKARIQWRPERSIHVVAVHLPIGKDGPRLQREGIEKLESLRGQSKEPWLIAGDFNADWLGAASGSCVDWLVDRGWETGVTKIDRDYQKSGFLDWTFPASQPRRSIDWIMSTSEWKTKSRIVPKSLASDHRPVIQTFELDD